MKTKISVCASIFILISCFLVDYSYAEQKINFNKVLQSTNTFRCVFTKNAGASISKGKINVHQAKENFKFILSTPNYRDGSIKMIGNAGSAKLGLMKTSSAIHTMEVTLSGNMNITTIFSENAFMSEDESKLLKFTFPAVHSRHISISQAIPSQYYGYCYSND